MENIILYNSRQLFYELGYFKTKMSNITKKCGISTGKFYRCYKSKEDLLIKIIKKDLDVYMEEVKALVPKHGEEIFKLKMIIRSIFNFFKKNPFFFAMLIELENKDEQLSSATRKWLNHFWIEVKIMIMELLKDNEKINKDKKELLALLVEDELKIYIKYLLSEKNGKCNPERILFLQLENDLNSISEMVINTFKSLDAFTLKQIIDPLTGAYTNKYFFELLEKNHKSGSSLNVIFLNLTIFYTVEGSNKRFFRDNIMIDIVRLSKKHFRNEDEVGRLCPSRFIILAPSEEIPFESLEFKFKNIFKELKIKYPFIHPEDILWKNIYIDSGEDILKKFKEVRSIVYNNLIPINTNSQETNYNSSL